MKKLHCLIIVLLFITLARAEEAPPFAMAVKVGDILYLAGQIGSLKPGKPPLGEKGIVPETHQTMKNIKKVLEENGSSLDQVFKCTVMMADMKEWPIMNEIYASYFTKDHYPVRSAFGTAGLALNARVEIECMAKVNPQNAKSSSKIYK